MLEHAPVAARKAPAAKRPSLPLWVPVSAPRLDNIPTTSLAPVSVSVSVSLPPKERPLRSRFSKPLEEVEILKARMPKILAACAAAGLQSVRDLTNTLVETFKIDPKNIYPQVNQFLQGKIVVPPAGRCATPILTQTAVRIAGHLKVPLREAYADFQIPENAYLHLPLDRSKPLDDFELLRTTLRPLGDALRNRGINTMGELMDSVVAKGAKSAAKPKKVYTKLADVLKGKVIRRRGGDFYEMARNLSKAAGLPPEIAFAPLLDERARREAELQPPPKERPLAGRPSRPLDDFEVLRTALRPLGDALRNRGINTLSKLAKGVVAEGAKPKTVYIQLAEVLKGKVFDDRNGNFTVTARHVSKAAGLPPEIAFAPLLDDRARREAELQPPPKERPLAGKRSRPLDDFEVLRTTLRPLGDALRNRGINTLSELVNVFVAKGRHPTSVYSQLAEVLKGKVFRESNGNLTVMAGHVSKAAGLPPEIAFAPLLDDRARREAELPQALKDRPLRGRPARPLEEVEILKARMPKILAACAAAGLQSVRDLKNIVVETFKVSRENARLQVNEFLQGKIVMPPAGCRATPTLTRTAVRIAGHLKVPLREAYADFEIPEVAYLHLPLDRSKPLDDFEVLRTTLRPLGDALRNRGINTLRELVNGVLAEGANPKSVHSQLAEVLKGKVFSERTGNLTVMAGHVSKAAGLPPEIAFAPLRKDRARPGGTLLHRVAAGVDQPSSPLLQDNSFLTKRAPRLLAGLLRNGLTREEDVTALYMAAGSSPETAARRARWVLGGDVVDPMTMRATRDARLLAAAAGVDPATAFEDAREKLREEIGPARGRRDREMSPD